MHVLTNPHALPGKGNFRGNSGNTWNFWSLVTTVPMQVKCTKAKTRCTPIMV